MSKSELPSVEIVSHNLDRSPAVVYLDATELTQARLDEIEKECCPGCAANFDRLIYAQAEPRKYACNLLSRAKTISRVDFDSPPKGEPIDFYLVRFRKEASCLQNKR